MYLEQKLPVTTLGVEFEENSSGENFVSQIANIMDAAGKGNKTGKKELINVQKMPQMQEKKTLVEISVNGNTDIVNWMKIAKPSKTITLNDIKTLLRKKPKMYGMSNDINYIYRVKSFKNGKFGFEQIEEDDSFLPLCEDKIELQCWSE